MQTDNVNLDFAKRTDVFQTLRSTNIALTIENVEYGIGAISTLVMLLITSVRRVFYHVLTVQPMMVVPILTFALKIGPVIMIIVLKNQIKKVFVVDYLELHVT